MILLVQLLFSFAASINVLDTAIIGIHNSYHLRPTDWYASIYYDYPEGLGVLLDNGVRAIEIDVHQNMQIAHSLFEDTLSSVPDVATLFSTMESWRALNANAGPIFIMMELKTDIGAWDISTITNLKMTIEASITDQSRFLRSENYPNRFLNVEMADLPDYVIMLHNSPIELTEDSPFTRQCETSERSSEGVYPSDCFGLSTRDLSNVDTAKDQGLIVRSRVDDNHLFQVEFCTFLPEAAEWNGEMRNDLIDCDGLDPMPADLYEANRLALYFDTDDDGTLSADELNVLASLAGGSAPPTLSLLAGQPNSFIAQQLWGAGLVAAVGLSLEGHKIYTQADTATAFQSAGVNLVYTDYFRRDYADQLYVFNFNNFPCTWENCVNYAPCGDLDVCPEYSTVGISHFISNVLFI